MNANGKTDEQQGLYRTLIDMHQEFKKPEKQRTLTDQQRMARRQT